MPGALAILKPFAWLAVAAFATGFLGYFALGPPDSAVAQVDPPAADVSFPASADWNLPRRI